MIDINRYIVEKLRINKNINTHKTEFEVGDPMIRVAIYRVEKESTDNLEVNQKNRNSLFYFNDYADASDKTKRIRFMYRPDETNEVDGYSYEKHMFINSNGYLEFYGGFSVATNPWDARILYLSKNDGINFLEDLLKDKDSIYKYFDSEDEFRKITINNSSTELKTFIRLLEDE